MLFCCCCFFPESLCSGAEVYRGPPTCWPLTLFPSIRVLRAPWIPSNLGKENRQPPPQGETRAFSTTSPIPLPKPHPQFQVSGNFQSSNSQERASKCGLCACAGPCTAGYRSVPNLTTKRERKPLENFIAFWYRSHMEAHDELAPLLNLIIVSKWSCILVLFLRFSSHSFLR